MRRKKSSGFDPVLPRFYRENASDWLIAEPVHKLSSRLCGCLHSPIQNVFDQSRFSREMMSNENRLHYHLLPSSSHQDF